MDLSETITGDLASIVGDNGELEVPEEKMHIF
jgi:hypothetical protein